MLRLPLDISVQFDFSLSMALTPQKFRADAFDSVRQIGELRARLRDKRGELER